MDQSKEDKQEKKIHVITELTAGNRLELRQMTHGMNWQGCGQFETDGRGFDDLIHFKGSSQLRLDEMDNGPR